MVHRMHWQMGVGESRRNQQEVGPVHIVKIRRHCINNGGAWLTSNVRGPGRNILTVS